MADETIFKRDLMRPRRRVEPPPEAMTPSRHLLTRFLKSQGIDAPQTVSMETTLNLRSEFTLVGAPLASGRYRR